MSFRQTGGCLCGAVRYEIVERPANAGYCYCRKCQRATGAPVFAGATVRKAAFRLLQGQPKRYQSSPRACRWFCGDCGSSLFFEPLDAPDMWEVLVGTLDDPSWVEMKRHVFTATKAPWFEVKDDLPRHAGWGEPSNHPDKPNGY